MNLSNVLAKTQLFSSRYIINIDEALDCFDQDNISKVVGLLSMFIWVSELHLTYVDLELYSKVIVDF